MSFIQSCNRVKMKRVIRVLLNWSAPVQHTCSLSICAAVSCTWPGFYSETYSTSSLKKEAVRSAFLGGKKTLQYKLWDEDAVRCWLNGVCRNSLTLNVALLKLLVWCESSDFAKSAKTPNNDCGLIKPGALFFTSWYFIVLNWITLCRETF